MLLVVIGLLPLFNPTLSETPFILRVCPFPLQFRKGRTSLAVSESLWLPPVLYDLEGHLNVPLVCKQLHHLLEEAKLVALALAFPSELPKLSTNLRHAYIGTSSMAFFKALKIHWNGFLPGNGWSFSPIFFGQKS